MLSVPGVAEFHLPSDVSCGFLTVPENRADPDGHTIKVAVARLDAVNADPDRDPMVYLNGGPGSTSILLAESLRDKGINNDRDVIFVAQRGTVLSEPFLSCPEYDEFIGATTGMSMLSPESARLSENAVRACHDRLAADGYDLGAYNTTENAADIADLRVALGIDSWHVYGVSYGTLLALQLIRNHPEGISSVVPHSPAVRAPTLGGTFDAITQPFLADSAAETLSDSRVVRFPAISHDVYAQSECGRTVVADFLVRPDSYETTCVEAMEIPQFIH